MVMDIFCYRVFFSIVKKELLPKVEVCPHCGSSRIQFKKRDKLGFQKGRCLNCGKTGYRR